MTHLISKTTLATFAATVAMGLTALVPAYAADTGTVQGTFQSMNGSGATGTAQIELLGNGKATFTVNISGVVPNMPHAQHVHFGDTTMSSNGPIVPPPSASDDFNSGGADQTTALAFGGNTYVSAADAEPVPASAQINYDNFINTLEGLPFYGSVQISLTTTGDTSPASGLAVGRFPAPAGNSYTYERTIDLTAQQIQQIKNGDVEIVVHGADLWTGDDPSTPAVEGDPTMGDGSILSYTFDSNEDGAAGTISADEVYPKSPLAALLGLGPLPLEATMPVATVEFDALPPAGGDGGAATTPIPTLGTWGLLALALLLTGVVGWSWKMKAAGRSR